MKPIYLFICLAVSQAVSAGPCDGVDRTLTAEQKVRLAPAVANQLQRQIDVKSVSILESFKFGGWQILYVSPGATDEAFLFYRGDPLKGPYLKAWPDPFAEHDGAVVTKVLENGETKGMPAKLVECYAWYVTNSEPAK